MKQRISGSYSVLDLPIPTCFIIPWTIRLFSSLQGTEEDSSVTHNLDSASYKSEKVTKDVNEEDHKTYEAKLSEIVDKIEKWVAQ